MTETIDTDSFAGGGGASTGIEMGLGRSPAIAINHDAEAIAMHMANHPQTEHLNSNIWLVDPLEATRGRKVRLAWFSPDCKHFSKAKGGKPVEKRIRDLAWVVVLWAKRVRPDVIMLENVEEFADWGPLTEEGLPCPKQKGFTFKRWLRELKGEGYKVEWRELRACDYGAPTIRKRLFLIARRDGKPIVWPKPTHGPGLIPYRTAAEIIDWSLPCPSIFLTKKEARTIGVKRPLAEATMARIAKGVMRYVINTAEPFIVNLTHHGGDRLEPMGEPLNTVTGAHRGEKALVAPYLVPRYGERDGQEPRTHSVGEPLPTVVPTGNGGMLVTPFLTGCGGRAAQSPPKGVDESLNTITAKADQILVVPHVMTMRGAQKPHTAANEPTHTITAGGAHQHLVAAFLAQHNGGMVGHDARKPVSTLTSKGSHQQLVAAHMLNLKGSDRRMAAVDAPTPTQTASGWHQAEVRAFLTKFYGTRRDSERGRGQSVKDPLHTVTCKPRHALVMVKGEPYEIVDIGMRMLTPRELFRAQGFPDSYIIEAPYLGKPLTKTAQIRMCGNSVCPDVVAALTRANLGISIDEAEAA